MHETNPVFEASQDYPTRSVQAASKSIVVRLIMRSGLAQTESAANTIAIGFAIICFAIAGYLAFGGSSGMSSMNSQTPPVGTVGPGGIPQP